MAGTTARLSLPFPQLTDAADISQAVPPLTTLLDSIMLAYAKGLLSARPAASATQLGRIYYATDNGIAYFCDGTNWQRLDLDMLNRIIALEAKIPTAASAFRADQTGNPVLGAQPANLSFGTLIHATNALSALVAGSSWTIPVAGLYTYDVSFQLHDPGGAQALNEGIAAYQQVINLKRNGTTIDTCIGYTDSGGYLPTPLQMSGTYVLAASDVLTVQGNCVNGTAGRWAGHFGFKLDRV